MSTSGFSLLVEEDLGFEHELCVLRNFILLAEVDLVSILTIKLQVNNLSHEIQDGRYKKFRLNHLRFVSSQVCSVSGISHAVVKLVSWVHIELEVGAHGCLNSAGKTLLDLSTDFLVIVAGAQLLVELLVLGSINTFDSLSGSSGVGHAGLATIDAFQ